MMRRTAVMSIPTDPLLPSGQKLTESPVMRACEGCRRRKIKCDAATTNTWPCSACIRLKLHCVRPNGYDGAAEPQVFEPTRPEYEDSGVHDFRQHLPMQQPQMLAGGPSHPAMYAPKPGLYSEPSGLYPTMQYPDHASAQGMQYTTVPSVGVVDQSYASTSQQAPQPSVFPTPPLQQLSRPESPPEVYNQDQYGQQDLSDLLGTLKLNDAGTGKSFETALSTSGLLLTLVKRPTSTKNSGLGLMRTRSLSCPKTMTTRPPYPLLLPGLA